MNAPHDQRVTGAVGGDWPSAGVAIAQVLHHDADVVDEGEAFAARVEPTDVVADRVADLVEGPHRGFVGADDDDLSTAQNGSLRKLEFNSIDERPTRDVFGGGVVVRDLDEL